MELDAPSVIRMPDILGRELVPPLARAIIRLELAPGTRLVEDDICRRYGISRSPVREALQMLAAQGLVERRPRRGMFVMAMTVERLDEIYACRLPLEGLAAEGAARAATPKLVARLRALVAEMGAAGAAGRREAAFDANVGLTDLLHEHCRNETLQAILAGLDNQALRYRYYCYRENAAIAGVDADANAALVDAIAATDAAAARAITEALIARSWTMIRETMVDRVAAAATEAAADAR